MLIGRSDHQRAVAFTCTGCGHAVRCLVLVEHPLDGAGRVGERVVPLQQLERSRRARENVEPTVIHALEHSVDLTGAADHLQLVVGEPHDAELALSGETFLDHRSVSRLEDVQADLLAWQGDERESGNSGNAGSIGGATVTYCRARWRWWHDCRGMEAANLARRLLDGDRRALARGITLVQDDDPIGWELVREVYAHTGRAAIVGVTGPPGSGKSTLIGALTRRRRACGHSVAVLSVDPTSPFTGGAVLGDRIRLTEHFLDRGVFIRSMASRGALGGLAEAALLATLLMDANGNDHILLETVGVGQSEVDVVDHADTVVLVLNPGAGDSVQALKAGVLEIPDVIVVNKADHPGTRALTRQIRGVLALSAGDGWRVPVIQTEATADRGIDELVAEIDGHRAWSADNGALASRRSRSLRHEVLALAAARIRRELDRQMSGDPLFQRLMADVAARRIDPASAARQIADATRFQPFGGG